MDKISDILKKTKLDRVAGVLAHFKSEKEDALPDSFCALGVLYHHKGRLHNRDDWEGLDVHGDLQILQEDFGITREQYRKVYDCPACTKSEFGLNEFLIHLNDYHDPQTRDPGVIPLTFKEIGQILEKDGL